MNEQEQSKPMTATERSHKHRAKLRENPAKVADARKKDRQRKAQRRAEKFKNQTRKEREDWRVKKKEEMRNYRRKLKEKEDMQNMSLEGKRREGGRKAMKKRKNREAVKRCRERAKENKLKKREAVVRTQKWRMRLRMKSFDTSTPDKNPELTESGDAFSSYSAERRALKKAKSALPPTPRRRTKVISKLVTSPEMAQYLDKQNVLMNPTVKKKLSLADEVLGSVEEALEDTRHTGTARKERARAYQHVKSIASKTSGLRKYFSLRMARAGTNVTESNWWHDCMCQRKKRRDRIPEDVRSTVLEFYLSQEVSRQVPDKKEVVSVVNTEGQKVKVQKHLMVLTLSEAYAVFKRQYPDKKIGFSTFKSLKPKQVRKVSETNRRTCLCTICSNISLKIDALKKEFGMSDDVPELKGMTKQMLADLSMCTYASEQLPSGKCLQRKCDLCGVKLLLEKKPFDVLLKKHKNENVVWNKWEYITITKKDKPKRCMSCVTKKTTLAEFLDDLQKALENFPAHTFRASWQNGSLVDCQKQLSEGQVLAVMDFSENYTCCFQNEVQTAFFDPTQVTIFPMMFYFKTRSEQEDTLAKFAIIGISDDGQHDAHLVRKFEDTAASILKNHVDIKKMIEYSDGCAAQFKGRTGFADISLQNFELERHFFETSHGKNVCDGLGALLKNACYQAVVSGKAVLGSASEMFLYAKNKLVFDLKPVKRNGKAELSARQYVFVDASSVDHGNLDLQVQTLQGTRKLHAVKNIPGSPYELMSRNLSCFCKGCQDGQDCQNKEYVEPWSIHKLQTQTSSKNATKPAKNATKPAKNAAKPAKSTKNKSAVHSQRHVPEISSEAESKVTFEPGDFIATKLISGGTKRRQKPVHVYMAEILEIDDTDAYVRFMKKCGGLYTWPETEDCAFQPLENLIVTVMAPQVVNERLQYRFSEKDHDKVKSILKDNVIVFA